MVRRALLAVTTLVAMGACSLVIDRDANQCETDRDCIGFSVTACDLRAHVCRIFPTTSDGGGMNPGPGTGDTGSDAGAQCGEDGGCYACVPTNDIQFGNACTDAKCQPFDNRARLKKL